MQSMYLYSASHIIILQSDALSNKDISSFLVLATKLSIGLLLLKLLRRRNEYVKQEYLKP